MKKSLVVLLVVGVLLASAVPALAAKGPPPPTRNRGGMFTLVGTITAINGSDVTVQVVAGNFVAQPFVGQSVTLKTTASTRFLQAGFGSGAVVITLDDLAVGQNVSAQGSLVNGVWTATRITVGAQIIHP